MAAQRPGHELPLLLLGAFRSVIDELHVRLAERGHPGLRPAHGFALQAVGDGASITEIGRRLDVSKQAASKTVERLEGMGYVTRVDDPRDGRQRTVRLTSAGWVVLTDSARILEDIRREWVERHGADVVVGAESLLAAEAGRSGRIDLAGWLGA